MAIGLFVATIGFSFGLDGGFFRMAMAVLMIGLGAILILPCLQARVALAAGPVSNWAEQRLGGFSTGGLRSQFGVGLLLGAMWSPCVGPTLGAASVLAAQGRDLPQVAPTMLAFGLGAAAPLLALGLLTREALVRMRDRLLAAGKGAKAALGVLLVLIGLAVVTGLDKRLEARLVELSPQWLTDLTTRF